MRLQQPGLPWGSEAATVVEPPPAAVATTPPATAEADAAPPAIQFVRRRDTRRYILRMLEDGSLRVTVPWRGNRRDAEAFVAAQHDWIARQRVRRASRPDRRWLAGHAVWLDGRTVPLSVVDGVVHCGDEVVGRAPDTVDLRPSVERWLRRRAVRDLPGELLALASRHEIAVTRVSVRDQRSRWGSCSRRGTISLNWRLVQVPPAVRDYVLIHELMHRRELNHSARFWRHVAAACPDYLALRRWLRLDGAQLF